MRRAGLSTRGRTLKELPSGFESLFLLQIVSDARRHCELFRKEIVVILLLVFFSFLNFFLRFLHYWILLLVQRSFLFWPPFQTKFALFGSFFSGEVIVAKETASGTQHVLPLSHFSLISSVAHFPHRFIPQGTGPKPILMNWSSLTDHCGISVRLFSSLAHFSPHIIYFRWGPFLTKSPLLLLVTLYTFSIFYFSRNFFFTYSPHCICITGYISVHNQASPQWLIWSVERWLPTRPGLIIDTHHPLSARRPDNYWYPPPCHPWYGKSLSSGWKSSWIRYRAALTIKT